MLGPWCSQQVSPQVKAERAERFSKDPSYMGKKKIVLKRPETSYQSTKATSFKDSVDERELKETRGSLAKEHGEGYRYFG